MKNCRCRECEEIKSIYEFRNLRWNKEETWVCLQCQDNSPEAEEERLKWRMVELQDRTDPALLIEDIDRRRKQLARIKILILDWEQRTGIELTTKGDA